MQHYKQSKRERQTERQRDRERESERDRERQGEKERERNRYRAVWKQMQTKPQRSIPYNFEQSSFH